MALWVERFSRQYGGNKKQMDCCGFIGNRIILEHMRCLLLLGIGSVLTCFGLDDGSACAFELFASEEMRRYDASMLLLFLNASRGLFRYA